MACTPCDGHPSSTGAVAAVAATPGLDRDWAQTPCGKRWSRHAPSYAAGPSPTDTCAMRRRVRAMTRRILAHVTAMNGVTVAEVGVDDWLDITVRVRVSPCRRRTHSAQAHCLAEMSLYEGEVYKILETQCRTPWVLDSRALGELRKWVCCSLSLSLPLPPLLGAWRCLALSALKGLAPALPRHPSPTSSVTHPRAPQTGGRTIAEQASAPAHPGGHHGEDARAHVRRRRHPRQ